ncbi:MAG: hypothetical protein ACLR2E_16200 [Lachnospiraceae bacterium]
MYFSRGLPGDILRGLFFQNLGFQLFHSRADQRVHGGGGFAEIVKIDGFDPVRIDGHGHIHHRVTEGHRRGVDAGRVALGGDGRPLLRRLFCAEHQHQKDDQDHRQKQKNSRIDQFPHFQYQDFRLGLQGETSLFERNFFLSALYFSRHAFRPA